MANSSPPWAAYCALMAYRLLALDKRPGVGPLGIVETLYQALDKFFMRAAGEQSKTACGDLQLCVGLEASIKGSTHAVGKRRLDRVIGGRDVEEVYASDEEEKNGNVADRYDG